jgi:hypothetical protein
MGEIEVLCAHPIGLLKASQFLLLRCWVVQKESNPPTLWLGLLDSIGCLQNWALYWKKVSPIVSWAAPLPPALVFSIGPTNGWFFDLQNHTIVIFLAYHHPLLNSNCTHQLKLTPSSQRHSAETKKKQKQQGSTLRHNWSNYTPFNSQTMLDPIDTPIETKFQKPTIQFTKKTNCLSLQLSLAKHSQCS